MKYRIAIILLIAFGLSACGTRPFVPQEYPLRDGLIPSLNISGDVVINNSQQSENPEIVYSYAGTKLATSYKDITQVMVDQTKKELGKNAKISSSENNKSIDLQVNYLKSTYIAFYWKSELKYDAMLGDGTKISKTVTHGSGNLVQDLNGCIAESVMDLLNDPKVIEYLSK